MKRANQKAPDDIIVQDAEAGMKRLEEATRHILSIPKRKGKVNPKRRKK